MDRIEPDYCAEAAAFLEAKDAEIRRKIEHLEKVSRLLRLAAETMRDFNAESDARLAAYVRELYQDIRKGKQAISGEACEEHED